MFSTFTGNSRRPRNVNLSGQVGNPFANTSWTPSAVSNATKTVSNAQADREKRQIERQRQKAVGKIQKTWRGHRVRLMLADSRRSDFDALQLVSSAQTDPDLEASLRLLLVFANPQRPDDLDRVLRFIHGCNGVDVRVLAPSDVGLSRSRRLMHLLVLSLGQAVKQGSLDAGVQDILQLISRVVEAFPHTTTGSAEDYFSAVARLCQNPAMAKGQPGLIDAVTTSLQAILNDDEDAAYHALAFHFLTAKDLVVLEQDIEAFAKAIHEEKLAQAIRKSYPSQAISLSKDKLLWLLAHFIHFGQGSLESSKRLHYLSTLYSQLSTLSSEIAVRIRLKSASETTDDEDAPLQTFDPYVYSQLMSLVHPEGISRLLADFSSKLTNSSQDFEVTCVLAGYILCLLQSFPGNADDTRMRLFLEQIPTAAGDMPIVKFLWRIMQQTSVFEMLRTESVSPVEVIRDYLHGTSSNAKQDQEWPIILMFLELYIFILRLSDDEDFFSGIKPQVLHDNASTSRIRSCSLSLPDVKGLSLFLRNTAFVLHYNAQAISVPRFTGASAPSRATRPGGDPPMESTLSGLGLTSAKFDLDSLRGIVTSALKMIYERDSRKQFLPADHWLMTGKLDSDEFVSAVIAEEERQMEEEEEGEDGNGEDDATVDDLPTMGGFYSTSTQRHFRQARFERMKAQQMRALRDRRMAELGPKLEVLKHMPFVVPFETRVMIFRQFIMLDRARRDGASYHFAMPPFAKHHARIRRGNLFEDAYKQFYSLGDGLKDPIQITFVDQFDTPEAGIDGGGVTKEFLDSVTTEAFRVEDDQISMFSSNDANLLYPNPEALDVMREAMKNQETDESGDSWKTAIHEMLKRYEFLGRIIGKCMYEGILVDFAFAGFFLLKWPSSGGENTYKGSVNDLRDMDSDLYNGMLQLKNYPGDVSELAIDFTITDRVSPPGEPIVTVTRKLVPNGDQVYVTNDNRLLYISYVARHRLVVQPYMQTNAFLRGLREIIKPTWLSMFNQSELQRLVGGDSTEIDIEDLRRNTEYSGLYVIGDDKEEHPTIKLFWKVMEGFTDSQRRSVLKYVSSTPRAPLLGFAQLRPKFSIRDGGTDEERLPSTSTCVNLLKLPRYTTEARLREKLLYAIESGAGFDLS
ncbi:hypothetical protein B0I35DRAFT_478109 [Stachybotrys elegans]|uniref:HECT-type E3 ubiquitin transferase n=1 Tax=Stachybotrys elegans TaxID=80388 RepID=A0A8K0SQ76_9HYPO|nr:hypothetical protein B0I35DRAFT_478109 [Stachybotrys elegans]